MKINWRNTLKFGCYSIFLLLAGKISASYEGCILLNNGQEGLRISFGIILLILAFIFLLLMKKDIFKLFVVSEDSVQ